MLSTLHKASLTISSMTTLSAHYLLSPRLIAISMPPASIARMMNRRTPHDLKHTSILPTQRWIAPLMDHMEYLMWDDAEEGGDTCHGRWTCSKLDTLIPNASTYTITQKAFTPAMAWVRRMTETLSWGNASSTSFGMWS